MKRALYALTLVAICAFLAACSAENGSTEEVVLSEIYQQPLAEFVATLPREQNQSIAHGANDFAFRLSAEMLAGQDGGNFIMSPFSVWLPLAALANVTNEEILGQLVQVLVGNCGDESLPSVEDINNAASQMLYYLTGEHVRVWGVNFPNPLHIANAIFLNQNMAFNPVFVNDFAKYFLGSAMNVDFAHPSAAEDVNRWAKDNTEGHIDNIVNSGDFDEDTVMAIVNAIYFSARWSREFDSTMTQMGTFYGTNAQTQKMLMEMSWGGNAPLEGYVRYYEDDFVQSLNLAFNTGGVLQILLPKNGDATDLLANMTAEYFAYINHNKIQATGRLVMPRFEIENDHNNLLDALEGIGVPLMNPSAHPLNAILDPEGNPIFLSDAMQMATISVDEEGTTAAAVTVMIGMLLSGPRIQGHFEMVANRPFVFILHKPSIGGVNQILFMGIVNQ